MEINLGWASGTIAEQLEKEGIKLDDKKVRGFDLAKEAISALYIMGYITDGEMDKIRNRLLKKLSKVIKEK